MAVGSVVCSIVITWVSRNFNTICCGARYGAFLTVLHSRLCFFEIPRAGAATGGAFKHHGHQNACIDGLPGNDHIATISDGCEYMPALVT